MRKVSVHRRRSGADPFVATHSFEQLESRVLLCATVAELVSAGIPESIIHDDGHIYRSDFEKLDAKLQQHVDPHWVQDDPGNIDYDKLLGIPMFMSEADARARGGPEAVEALPDFFPQMMSTNIDQTTQTGRTLFRFGTQVNNQGAGPGCLISNNPGATIPTGAPITSWVNPDGSQNVLQPVYTYTGSGFSLMYYRLAGKMTYHSGHGHLHYEGYASYRLRARNTDGTPGAYIERSDGSGIIGAKVGFCLLTFSGTFTTEGGISSSTLPGYNQDTGVPSSCGYNQGIRVGHYDQYSSGLEGQWLDVTGVPNGQYFVEIELDAENTLLESNEANNAKTFAITLNVNPPSGTPITPDQFDSSGLHNDSFATAADMGELGAFTQTGLNIDWGQDRDYFRFRATSSGNGTISTTASNGNVDLFLYDGKENLLIQSTLSSGTDSVNWNFIRGAEYYVKVQSYNSTTSSNYQIAWNVKPTVEYPVWDSVASEVGPNTGTFLINRNGPTTTPLTVTFALGGSATLGQDYTISSPDGNLVGSNITLGTLASTVRLIITPIPDNDVEGQETVMLTIANGGAYVSVGGTSIITIDDKPRANPFPGGGPGGGGIRGGFGGLAAGGSGQQLFNDLVRLGAEREQDLALAGLQDGALL